MGDKVFVFSNDRDDLSNILSQFRADNCLKKINRKSVEIFENKSNSELGIAVRESFMLCQKGHSTPVIQQDTIITPWDLIDLAYHVVLVSDDFVGSDVESNEEFSALFFAVYNYLNQEKSPTLHDSDESKEIRLIKLLIGSVGEQIKFQRTHWIFDNMFRDIHILFELNDSNQFNAEMALREQIGNTSWKTIVANLVRAFGAFCRVGTLDEVIRLMPWNNSEERTGFIRLIERYTTDYEEIRTSKLGRQIFYKKPYVKTERGEIISVNTFLNLFLCEHCVYWIIRDHFHSLAGQSFTNFYGELFEKYFKELLSSCLKPDEYQKIPECKYKRADWKLCVGNWKFLIEQKSALIRLDAKQQQPDVEAILEFIRRNIIPAIVQLESTENEFADGKYIKIVLLHEDYIKAEWLDFIMALPECTPEDDHYYWLATIRELEMLLHVAKTNPEQFDIIIQEKVNREINHTGIGRGIIDILAENGIQENKYIREMKSVQEILNSQEVEG